MSFQVPVPDATTWVDSVGGSWTSHGADVTVHDPPGWGGVAFTIEIETSTPGTFLDVTDDYVSARWADASRDRWGQNWSPGSAVIVLQNPGVPHPFGYRDVPGTQYFGQDDSTIVRLGRAVRVTAIHGDESTPMFYGYVADVSTDVSEGQPNLTTIGCKTALASIARASRTAVTPVGAGDTESERIERILDSAGWSASLRDYQIGATEYTAVPNTDLSGSPVDEANVAAVSFIAEFLEDVKAGTIRYVNLAALPGTADAVIELRSMYEPSYANLYTNPVTWHWGIGQGNVVNFASCDQVSSTGPYQYTDVTSVADFGRAVYERSDLIGNASLADALAFYQVAHFAEPTEEPDRVVIASGAWDVVDVFLNLRPLDVVGPLYYQERWPHVTHCQVVGVEHEILPGNQNASGPGVRADLWTVTVRLDSSALLTTGTPVAP